MKELSITEAKSINGGEVPVSYYMDNDTIAQNAKLMEGWLKFAVKVVEIVVPMVLARKI